MLEGVLISPQQPLWNSASRTPSQSLFYIQDSKCTDFMSCCPRQGPFIYIQIEFQDAFLPLPPLFLPPIASCTQYKKKKKKKLFKVCMLKCTHMGGRWKSGFLTYAVYLFYQQKNWWKNTRRALHWSKIEEILLYTYSISEKNEATP